MSVSPVAPGSPTDTAMIPVLRFRVDGVTMAAPSAIVSEVARDLAVTRVPHAPACVDGVASLRGAVLPVISAARLLGRAETPATAAGRLIVMDLERPLALKVDAVIGLGEMKASGHGKAPVFVAEDEAIRVVDLDGALLAAFGTTRTGGASSRPLAAGPGPEMADQVEATTQILTFTVAGQTHGLPIAAVVEAINTPQGIASLPHGERADLGVVPYRRGVLPVVDLAALMGLVPPTAAGKLIVVRIGSALAGLRVDGLQVVLRIPDSAIGPAPALLNRGGGEAAIEALARVGSGRVVSLLSPERLFRPEALEQIMADGRQELETVAEDSMQDTETFLIFHLGGETYGLPVADIDEVVTAPETLTRVPNAPGFIEGVMDLRGRVVPVIDQGKRFGADRAATTVRKVIVTAAGALQAGFIVDAVAGIRAIARSDLAPASDLLADDRAIFDRVARNPDGTVILIADARTLLDQAEADVLAALSPGLGSPA
ncbi:chemotaxis protein CheW [Brevundimonas goettingensis]|uniref:Chemotaxis protein CheW n=1 Tax=Brevundimonas goettingensis TaxID=2774190 RepID=A0A975GXH7_9CAUL|nr:chemotaxis protein CheW [Brevundimonas goettingensis]QTC92889.1 chemotaxis protein CheW [Brevundimonas goettingensis]